MATEPTPSGECQFKYRLGEKVECTRPAIRDGHCIFHTPKYTSAEKESLPEAKIAAEKEFEEQFRRELFELFNTIEGSSNGEPIDFRGFEFPEFTLDKNVTKKILFTGAVFHQEAKFSDITFQQEAVFSHARFREGADFGHATFEQKASFYGVTSDKKLTGSASFSLTTFNGDADFSHATFHQPAYFGGATFGQDKSATFAHVKFKDVASFQQTEFHGRTVFSANFEQEAYFSNTKFKRNVPFKGSTFSKDKKTDFRSAEFFSVDFTDIIFPSQTDFSDTTYEHEAKFVGVTFREEANFRGSVFIQMVYFTYACFNKGADFFDVLFRHIADFSDATFAGEIRFVRRMHSAFYEGETDTVRDFLGESRFRRLILEDGAEVIFDKMNLSQATFLDTNVADFIFRDVRWFQPESLTKRWFRYLLVRYIRHRQGAPAEFPSLHEEEDTRDRQQWLIKRFIYRLEAEIQAGRQPEAVKAEPSGQIEEKSQSSKEQTNSDNENKDSDENTTLIKTKRRLTLRDRALYRFRKIALRGSDPDTSSNSGLSREKALWDEFYNVIDVSEKDYEKIAENYRQLVLNYEKKREYDVAENFHFGEMHMRRRRKEASRKWWMPSRWINGHSIYWLSSSYGTSYRRALLSFAIIFLLVSIAFQYSGYQIIEPKSGTVIRTVEYEIMHRPDYQTVSFLQWLDDFSQSLMYTLSLITFQKGDLYRPLDALSRLWLSVGTLALAGQAALFFLAIRRRFKR